MEIRIGEDEVVFDGKFIKTIRRHFTDTNGSPQVWEMVKRKHFGRIVAMVAITNENEIILEKIYRIPFKEYVIELPAGLMDKPGESEEDAIKRELLEETGYSVDKVSLLVSGPFNTGMLEDELAIYFGLGAVKVQEPELESSEDISIVKVPLNNLLDYLSSLGKTKYDIKISAIIPYLQKRGLSV